jgi:hypothetical protein
MSEPLSHDAAIDALCGCAATVSVLSYQEVIEGYLKLRGLLEDPATTIEALQAQVAEIGKLKAVNDVAWKHAQKMRTASKRVGPYSNDPRKTEIWVRSLYHEGKDLMQKMRAALGQGEG